MEISGRIEQKKVSGLLPLVERAAELRRDRQDLVKIQGQLRERRDGLVARARAAFEAGDAKAAAAALAGVVEDDFVPDQRGLIARVRRAVEMEAEITRLVTAAKVDSKIAPEQAVKIFDAGTEYLSLNPKHDQIRRLVRQAERIAQPLLVGRQRERMLSQPPIENSIGMRLNLLPAGTFRMGQTGGDSDETPHDVTLTQPFYIGVHAVTNAQWKQVMGSVPSERSAKNLPVTNVNWDEVTEFCRKLSALPEEKLAGRVYRLPTEAEWEYACRAGSTTKWSFGDDESRLGDYAWFEGNSGKQTHPVGMKKPNAWGLFDMHGNVREWCCDGHSDYGSDAVTDPQGPSGTSGRVFRGGGWVDSAGDCRSARRLRRDPSYRIHYLGFRLALSPPGAEPVPSGYAPAAEVMQVLAKSVGAKFISLAGIDIPADVVGLLPKSFARENTIIPVAAEGDMVRIATTDPADVDMKERLEFILNRTVEQVLAVREEIIAAINRSYGDPLPES